MTKRAPEFCYIAPTEYLEFTTVSSTHLTLAHLVDVDAVYASHYKAVSDLGDYIIMDNSAYELKESFDANKLIELGHACGANAIVLPDYPFHKSDITIKAAEQLIGDIKKDGFDTFFVPQSEPDELDDWLYAYEWAANNPDIDIIGMSILGIPNAIPAVAPSFARVVMTQILLERGMFQDDKHHHYLGLNSGPALEIPSLLRMGVLDSIDSSGPIWAGILGHTYTTDADSFQQCSKLKMPVNFNYPLTRDAPTLKRIQHNIDLTQTLFSGAINNNPWYAQE